MFTLVFACYWNFGTAALREHVRTNLHSSEQLHALSALSTQHQRTLHLSTAARCSVPFQSACRVQLLLVNRSVLLLRSFCDCSHHTLPLADALQGTSGSRCVRVVPCVCNRIVILYGTSASNAATAVECSTWGRRRSAPAWNRDATPRRCSQTTCGTACSLKRCHSAVVTRVSSHCSINRHTAHLNARAHRLQLAHVERAAKQCTLCNRVLPSLVPSAAPRVCGCAAVSLRRRSAPHQHAHPQLQARMRPGQ